jgi:hypothetical protein
MIPRPSPDVLDGLKHGLLLGAALLALLIPPAVHHPRTSPSATPVAPRLADFRGHVSAPAVRHIANWVVSSGDNQRLAFAILDKLGAAVYLFDAEGSLQGSTAVLIGAAVGDHTVEGIGQRPIASVRPEERTTPAGRFVSEPGRNTQGEDVIWVDYDAAVSMHRVRTHEPAERRLERLASPSSDDNRISYGCINVPVAFFEQVLKPALGRSHGIVYVLPEVQSLDDVFPQAFGKGHVAPHARPSMI